MSKVFPWPFAQTSLKYIHIAVEEKKLIVQFDNIYMIMVSINLVSQLHLFPLKFSNHGLFGRLKNIESGPNLEPAGKEQL